MNPLGAVVLVLLLHEVFVLVAALLLAAVDGGLLAVLVVAVAAAAAAALACWPLLRHGLEANDIPFRRNRCVKLHTNLPKRIG